MKQPRTVSRQVLAMVWLVIGAAMVAVPGWLLGTRAAVLLHGHPVTLAVAAGCALAGLVALGWAGAVLWLGERYDPEAGAGRPGHRSAEDLRRRDRRRLAIAVPALVLCLATAGLLAWSRPFAATDLAVTAMRDSTTVRVADRLTWFELRSTRRDRAGREVRPRTALIFYPGARVDARAYAHVLRPLAEAGHLVVVLKEPFGIGLIGVDHAERVIEVHPEIVSWTVSGHSLGGVAAAQFADEHPVVKGLLLYAAYPAGRLERTDLRVVSLFGTEDGLATPADVEASRSDLPAETQFVPVQGGVHAFFGDYGNQPGDGTPTTTRAVAQAEIARGSLALLTSVAPPATRR